MAKSKTTTKKESKESKAVTQGGGKYKIKRALTLPQLKQSVNETVYIKFTSEMSESKVPPKEGEEPATVANVICLETGQEHVYIVPAVLKGVLEDEMEGKYVDECFQVSKLPKPSGKRYNQYEIHNIEA